MKIARIIGSSKEGQIKPEWKGWLGERFGDHYAQISTDTTLRLKMAIRDVSRFKRGCVPPDIEEWCKKLLLPPQGVNDLNFVLGYETDEGYVPGSIEIDQNLQAYINKYPQDWEVVKRACGLQRSKSRHACGFVIANKPIDDFIPLITVSDTKCTDFTSESVEVVGGLKMDFLKISILQDIIECLRLVNERRKIDLKEQRINGKLVPAHRLIPDPISGNMVDIWDLPEDQSVFIEIAEGKTETVFQLGSEGAIQWLPNFNHPKPDGNLVIDSIEAIADFNALNRPGPLDIFVTNPENNSKHNMLVEYTRRARGLPGSKDVLPILDQLIPETYGVMIFQEQLQKIYQYCTDCTGTEAEEFRTNTAKKKKEKVDKAYPKFMERASTKLGEQDAQSLWDFMVSWSRYGFNKSHSISYSVISYACSWLKHHYNLEWWCSILQHATKDEINEKFWKYCGHLVLLPDLQLSKAAWTIEGDKIRAPLSVLHGVGDKAFSQLMKGSPYPALEDFARSIVMHRKNNKAIKPVKNKKTGEYQDKEVWGRSAINTGMVYSMMVSGCLDSITKEFTTPKAAFDEFTKLLKTISKEEGGKAPSVKKVQDLDALARYQLRKSILPAWGSDLRSTILAAELPPYLLVKNEQLYCSWAFYGKVHEESVIGLEKLNELCYATEIPDGGYVASVVAYVEDKRDFNWGSGKTKQGTSITIEVGAGKFDFCWWPDKDGQLPDNSKTIKPGQIIVARLSKFSAEKPFTFQNVKIIREPLKEESDDTTEE
jgi:Bacterial DNA polymerase III alpha subunit finger domain/Bacterial DNA polymerase III alpha NTPase domain